MDDLISRQAAIDAVKCGALSAAMVYGRTDEGSTALYETVKAIKALPSAQPDRSLWFRIGEICVDESKGFITAGRAFEKIRELLREAERRTDDTR